MSNTPNFDRILQECFNAAKVDTPEWEIVQQAWDEVETLKSALAAERKSHEAASKALNHMQFVQLEELLNKYCALRDTLKNLVEGLGYTVQIK